MLAENVKWVKVGIRTMEGWARMLLKIPRCQVDARPKRKPGNSMTARFSSNRKTGSFGSLFSNHGGSNPETIAVGEARAIPLPTRDSIQAAKMTRNLGQMAVKRDFPRLDQFIAMAPPLPKTPYIYYIFENTLVKDVKTMI